MSIYVNDKGEVPGMGPEWACDAYGTPGHDYQECATCKTRFTLYMAAKTSTITH